MMLDMISNLMLIYQFGFFFCQFWDVRFGCGACWFRKIHSSNRLLAQIEESKSKHFKCSSGLLSINAFATAAANTVFTTPPFLLSTWRNVLTLQSKVPKIKDIARFCNEIFENSFFFLSKFRYAVLNILAVHSSNFKWELVFWNFFTVAVGPWTGGYCPIWYYSIASSFVQCFERTMHSIVV